MQASLGSPVPNCRNTCRLAAVMQGNKPQRIELRRIQEWVGAGHSGGEHDDCYPVFDLTF